MDEGVLQQTLFQVLRNKGIANEGVVEIIIIKTTRHSLDGKDAHVYIAVAMIEGC